MELEDIRRSLEALPFMPRVLVDLRMRQAQEWTTKNQREYVDVVLQPLLEAFEGANHPALLARMAWMRDASAEDVLTFVGDNSGETLRRAYKAQVGPREDLVCIAAVAAVMHPADESQGGSAAAMTLLADGLRFLPGRDVHAARLLEGFAGLGEGDYADAGKLEEAFRAGRLAHLTDNNRATFVLTLADGLRGLPERLGYAVSLLERFAGSPPSSTHGRMKNVETGNAAWLMLSWLDAVPDDHPTLLKGVDELAAMIRRVRGGLLGERRLGFVQRVLPAYKRVLDRLRKAAGSLGKAGSEDRARKVSFAIACWHQEWANRGLLERMTERSEPSVERPEWLDDERLWTGDLPFWPDGGQDPEDHQPGPSGLGIEFGAAPPPQPEGVVPERRDDEHRLVSILREAVRENDWRIPGVPEDHEAIWLASVFLPDGRPLLYALKLRGGRLVPDEKARWALEPTCGREGAEGRLRRALYDLEKSLRQAWKVLKRAKADNGNALWNLAQKHRQVLDRWREACSEELGDILAQLPAGNARMDLLIEAHGPLHATPWDLLQMGPGSVPAYEQYASLTYAVCLRVLQEQLEARDAAPEADSLLCAAYQPHHLGSLRPERAFLQAALAAARGDQGIIKELVGIPAFLEDLTCYRPDLFELRQKLESVDEAGRNELRSVVEAFEADQSGEAPAGDASPLAVAVHRLLRKFAGLEPHGQGPGARELAGLARTWSGGRRMLLGERPPANVRLVQAGLGSVAYAACLFHGRSGGGAAVFPGSELYRVESPLDKLRGLFLSSCQLGFLDEENRADAEGFVTELVLSGLSSLAAYRLTIPDLHAVDFSWRWLRRLREADHREPVPHPFRLGRIRAQLLREKLPALESSSGNDLDPDAVLGAFAAAASVAFGGRVETPSSLQ